MAYLLPSQAMNVIRGPVAVLESTIHARAISWWERTQCLRWRALLKRRQGGFVIAWSRRCLQSRSRVEIHTDKHRFHCSFYATEAEPTDSIRATSVYVWMTYTASSM